METHVTHPISQEHLAAAEEELRESLDSAGIDVRIVESAEAAAEASLLLDEIWSVTGSGTTVLEPSLFIALAHAKNYTAAAHDRDSGNLLGVTVGFFAAPVGKSMHSHVAGVRHEAVGRGIGAAMKLHQRLWCLERGITHMTWTYDPLIARNAYFNITRLGALPTAYHPDFYGQMRDGVNAGHASDRAFVEWDLTTARPDHSDSTRPDAAQQGEASDDAVAAVRIDADGSPLEFDVPREATLVSIEMPSDIETLRGTDPELASRWREVVRRAFLDLFADGWKVTGFRRSGAYLLTHP
ncbi:hypothetical protein [Brevibacterium jeotgali]|uniref:Predicted acetyltransferase, GNAT superfamily n=1 Tax=Brevibacterium jeotgali TaxID=1262550 RepID=A0A2H1L3Y1_9MICO|nr:hypothetical protein [Brevibacterium jeotgali]TWB98793.1 putative GNAT superfamily acetyltransferase [Brevibacterium jeotgali]SMY11607.1 Predicted acetyltransferase, GNAT superfamily [Brevibacterium jeotgali]